MSNKNLSLQGLYDLIENKADKDHVHQIAGNIESALYLDGVPAKKFVRNDRSLTTINSNTNNTSLELQSNTVNIKTTAGENKAHIYIDTDEQTSSILNISGTNDNNVYVNITGGLYVNGQNILSDTSTSDSDGGTGTEFIISESKPLGQETGGIWAQIVDSDQIYDDDAITGSSYEYTVPLGTIVATLSSIPPDGYIFADGQTVSRIQYAALWEFVKKKSYLITDKYWKSKADDNTNVEYYSKGDNLTSFRVPKLVSDNENIKYVIKAFEDVTVRDITQINALADAVQNLSNSQIIAGVGYIKYAGGLLIQYGSATDGIYKFSVPFINTDYSISVTYEGSLNFVYNHIDTDNKLTTGCLITTYDSTNNIVNNAKTTYIAIGRWKEDELTYGFTDVETSAMTDDQIKALVKEYTSIYTSSLTDRIAAAETTIDTDYKLITNRLSVLENDAVWTTTQE